MRSLAHVLLAVTLAGCQLPQLTVSDPADLEIVAGPGDAVTVLTNQSAGPMPFDWNAWNFLLVNHLRVGEIPWTSQQSTLPTGCGGDGFLIYRPATGETYSATLSRDPGGTQNGWCWGVSLDMGITWTWTALSEAPPLDGARISYTQDGLWLADGGPAPPVHLIRYSHDRTGRLLWNSQAFNVPLGCRRIARTSEERAPAFVLGLSSDSSTWEVARLWPSGEVDIAPLSAYGITIPVPIIGLNARNGSQTLPMDGCSLSDAWIDHTHNVLWFAVTQPCARDASHPCVGFYGLLNSAPVHVPKPWDDPSTFNPELLGVSSTDLDVVPNEDSIDTFGPRITVDDQGSVLFVAARSGPTRYASMIVGGANVALNELKISDIGPPGLAPYKDLGPGIGVRDFDFLGISPDPSDRRYAWAIGEAVQSSSGASDTSVATVIRFGRQCDPVTHGCAQ